MVERRTQASRGAVTLLAVLGLVFMTGCRITYRQDTGWETVWGESPSGERDPDARVPGRPTKPPRSAGRVRLALYPVVVGPGLGGTIKQERLDDMWRAHFVGDRRFNLVSDRKVREAMRDEERGNYKFWTLGNAVRLRMLAHHVMKPGYDPRTRKFRKMPVLVLTATAEWKSAGVKERVEVEGSFFNNVRMLEQLADKAKAAVLER